MLQLLPSKVVGFQRTGFSAFRGLPRDWNGVPLRVDGDPGPKTIWAWEISQLSTERICIVEACLDLMALGVIETAPNRGPIVDKILAPAGLSGEPWCMATVSYVMRAAQHELEAGGGITWPVYHVGVQEAMRAAVADGREIDHPLPGDWFGFERAGIHGHAGVVLSDDGYEVRDEARRVMVFEGNSSNRCRVGIRMISAHGRGDLRFFTALEREVSPAVPPKLDLLDGGGTT